MLKERFYFSNEYKIVNLECLATKNYSIVGYGSCKTKKSAPRVTVCGIWNTETNILSFGVARCSSADIFNKKKGRDLSFERALHSPYRIVKIPTTAHVSDVFMLNAKEIEEKILGMTYPININGE